MDKDATTNQPTQKFIKYQKEKPKVETSPPKKTPILKLILQIVGNLLIFASLAYLFLWSYPIISPQIKYYYDQLRGIRYEIATDENQAPQPSKNIIELLEKPKEPLKVIPVATDFGIVIEKINVNAPIIANVDAANEAEYTQALNSGVAHAKGTRFPGEQGNSFLFSHSTFNVLEIGQYNAVFTLLGKLEVGDTIITFYQGKRFDYQVSEQKIVNPDDVGPLTADYDEPVLTLQTCDPPGTSLRRLIVIAKLKE